MPSRCHQSITPYVSEAACLQSEPDQEGLLWDPSGGMGNAAMAEALATRGADGNFADHGIRPPDQGPFARRVALTFDDGPDIASTPLVLDILKKYGIEATFFVHGEEIDGEEAEALLRRMRDEGHIVANHSERHENLGRNPERAGPSIAATHDRIDEVTDPSDPRFFRFPGGNASQESIGAAEGQGYAVVGWHGDSNDWCYNDRGPVGSCDLVAPRHRDNLVSNVLAEADRYEGGILLFHDNRAYTADVLPQILDALINEGFTFTNLDDEATFPLLNSQASQLAPGAHRGSP